jgi:cytochrome P450
MATLTLNIVGRTLLGIDLTQSVPAVRSGLEAALEQFSGNSGPGFTGPAIRRATAIPELDDSAIAPVHELVEQIIDERREHPADERGDVVSALLAASAGPDGLTAVEVHDNVITLLMAGHETTANALSFTLRLLGTHPQVQEDLHREVDTLDGRAPAVADLAGLTYTRAVVTEAMRLYPPAWILGRTLTTDLEIGGYQVPAGSVAAVSPLLLHHDPRWFPQPEVFDPSRWLDARRDAVPRNAYLAFGTGPRSCIGEQFAWAEAVSVLATIAQLWTVAADPARPIEVQYRVTLRPAGALPVTVHAR